MKKIINLISIIVISFIFLSTIVFATDIDMNLPTNNESNNNISNQTNNTNSVENEVYDDNTITDNEDEYTPQSTTVSSVSSVTEETFGLSQILNIFLIVVGVVLILLGIAILIRLKS